MKTRRKTNRIINKKCQGMTFEECELKIVRDVADKMELRKGKILLKDEDVQKIIQIVEEFIRKKKCICYGGTAINNILPTDEQFYNKDVEFPDYDFFSPNAIDLAKELADIYYTNGYTNVEAKSAVHSGTFKVFVNFLPIADITYIHKELFNIMKKTTVSRSGIMYAPPNFLRMGMYLELSRPFGDVSRWEKIMKRLTLLNKHFPLRGISCSKHKSLLSRDNKLDMIDVFHTLRDILVSEDVVFFGAYANELLSRYMPKHVRHKAENLPDFDCLSETPKETSDNIKNKLMLNGYKNVIIKRHRPIGELVSHHYEIKINNFTVAFVFKPSACHSYNVLNTRSISVKVATIDTMLSFYLAFLYTKRSYFNVNKILCLCEFLFKVQQHNRLEQKGLLKRFTTSCIGYQDTIHDIRANKARKHRELQNQKDSKEYKYHFFRYIPTRSTIRARKNKTMKRNK